MSSLPPAERHRASCIRLLVLDVDGVLTDGRLHYGPDGETVKVFHVRDGLGVKMLRLEGIEIGVISARRAPALERRLSDLGVVHTYLGREDKLRAFSEMLEAVDVDPEEEVAFVGDDLVDLPVLRRVGLPITVQDGHELVRAEARWITEARGGHGAVREVADGLLEARGRLHAARDAMIQGFEGPKGGS